MAIQKLKTHLQKPDGTLLCNKYFATSVYGELRPVVTTKDPALVTCKVCVGKIKKGVK
jgi:hypothetical protein